MFPAAWARRHARERLGIDPAEMDGGHYLGLGRPRELADRLAAYAAEIHCAGRCQPLVRGAEAPDHACGRSAWMRQPMISLLPRGSALLVDGAGEKRRSEARVGGVPRGRARSLTSDR
jgi:hypothetical protein